ncbi:MAG: Glu/Leu/Phe/Val dehydrogenase dimerization domain-containing protein [Pyrinomonadaceae bacterium]
MKLIKELVETYKNTDPEIVYEWDDTETDAKGWLVINSLRGGAAGGGTRMRKGATKDEVLSLAKTMEVKFTVAGPAIGGAKSGIDFDPEDSRKADVLKRWFKAISSRLKSYYGTGGDLNVSDQEVLDYTKPYVGDPQEGIVVGQKKQNIEKIIEQLQAGVSLKLYDAKYTPLTDGTYKINDMITGFGVVESFRHYYQLFGSGESLQGKKAIIQGWGNVGAAAGYFLAQNGAKIVAISDGKGSVIKNDGFSIEEIIELFKGTFTEPKGIIKHKDKDEGNRDAIFDVKADIFAPCAGSFLVSDEYIDKLYANGVEVIASGANVPFAGQQNANIYSDTTANADGKLAVIPDFIANSGMAHTFAYLMKNDISVTEDGIFTSVSETISKALSKIKDEFGKSNSQLTEKAIRIALRDLGYE